MMKYKESYKEMKDRHQKEFDTFSNGKIFYIFSSGKELFEEELKKEGLTKEEIRPIGFGGFIKKEYIGALKDLTQRHKREKQEAIEQDKDGSGFIKSMFIYELYNHEFAYTRDTEDTLNDLGYTIKQISNNPALENGLDLAVKAIVGDDI